jgi:hypothetical protein
MLDSLKTRWRDFLDEHSRLNQAVDFISRFLPPLNYITIHYAYFTSICLASSLIYWGSSQPFGNVSYIDSLFLVTSSMTCTGLNTLNLSTMTTWQQIQLWFLSLIGSPIWISIWTVLTRKRAFEQRFEDIVERERAKRKSAPGLKRAPNLRKFLSLSKYSTSRSANNPNIAGLGSRLPAPPDLNTPVTETEQNAPTPASRRNAPSSSTTAADSEGSNVGEPSSNEKQNDNGKERELPPIKPIQDTAGNLESPRDHISFAEPVSPRHRTPSNLFGLRRSDSSDSRQSSSSSASSSSASEDLIVHWKKFLGKHNVTRNGQISGLSSEEREYLGGCEYRALKVLSVTVPAYFVLWQLIGAIALGAWLRTRNPGVPSDYGVNSWWTGIFYSVSAFNNSGMTLIDDSVIPFQSDYFMLIVIGLLILAGNTAYPIFLRLILWSTLKLLQLTTHPATQIEWKETLEFILKYPRRVYTTLFPARATWWLVGVLLFVNCADWLSFEILNIGNPAIKDLSVSDRIVDGLFQAVCKSQTSGKPSHAIKTYANTAGMKPSVLLALLSSRYRFYTLAYKFSTWL